MKWKKCFGDRPKRS